MTQNWHIYPLPDRDPRKPGNPALESADVVHELNRVKPRAMPELGDRVITGHDVRVGASCAFAAAGATAEEQKVQFLSSVR